MIPNTPGVYIFRGSTDRVLYVGKAIDLNSRVSSYFQISHPRGVSLKTQALVDEIVRVETIVVESELEALILEANLIKKYQPRFNVKLTDDKGYLYIVITKGEFPKVETARKKDLKLARKYWGPFPSSRTVRETLRALRKVFPWCSNSPQQSVCGSRKTEVRRHPCFYYHLGLCPGVCVGAVSKKDYSKIINRFSKFMDGRKDELISELFEEMTQLSKQQKFEEAAKIKKIIDGITYITQQNRVKLYLENPNFLEEERQLALEELKKDLNLEKLPERIEGYDISNIQGKEATGSMVVLTSGEIDKSQYRKFKINPPAGGSGKPNDVRMLAEIIRRRLKHQEWPMPDLIIVDGGRGQARAAKCQMSNVPSKTRLAFGGKCQIPVFGLAKKMEWLYPPTGEVVKLPQKSLSSKLLRKLRDEAHRFAISYHRKLRDKDLLRS